MPTTTLKGLSVQAAGTNSGTWGAGAASALNEGVIEFLDTMLAGNQAFSVASSNVTLSAANVRQCNLRFTGVLLSSIVVSPDVGVLFNGFYYWENLTTGSFTITVDSGVGTPVVLPQTRRGILFVDSTNGPRIYSSVGLTNADPIPVGTVMLFYQNAAPSGWTISSALNDYALKIVSSAGGVTSGSVAYSTLFGRTATDSTAISIDQMPLHGHPTYTCINSDNALPTGALHIGNLGQTNFAAFTGTPNATAGQQIGGTGGGNGHTHAIDMRVLTASVILATKN